MTEQGGTEILEGHDQSQADMMAENCILVDSNDRSIGSASKVDCHSGEGMRHRAFSVLLFDTNDRLLLQRRSVDKITFPGIWANSCCSHPLDIDGENGDVVAGVISAAKRKLDQELGIPLSVTSEWDFIHIGSFQYRCRWDENWIEHEIDHVLVVKADVEVAPNPNEISDIKWVDLELLDQIMDGEVSDDMVIAPWFRAIHDLYIMDNYDETLEHSDVIAENCMMGDLRMDPRNTSGQSLLDALSSHREIVEGVIMSSLGKMEQERLHGAMTHLFSGGGKRLRAILPYLVGEAVGEVHDGHYTLGACIEIIHNFTLVHDDIMDQDSIRRGLEAVHVAYDDATAINAGDAMLAVGFEILAESPHIENENLAFLVRSIGEMVRKVAEGQMVDMEFENREDVSEADYISMIKGKTSAMFETCSMTGAKLAGADDATVKNMAEWGLNLGLCFQIMDDLIDITGDTETLGKPAGSDVVQGKRTLIAIRALECGSELPMFTKVFGAGECSDEDLAQAVSELESSGSIDYAKQRAMNYHSLAHSCLDALDDSPALSILRELTDFQLTRIN
jgi:geranylgeranyl diphosphate synthase type I